jgi:hypothetical protein
VIGATILPGGILQEALMRGTIAIAALTTLFLVGAVVLAGSRVAGTKATDNSNAMPIYNLHALYPNMKNLPVHEAPPP